jgi:hypothetical protein
VETSDQRLTGSGLEGAGGGFALSVLVPKAPA